LPRSDHISGGSGVKEKKKESAVVEGGIDRGEGGASRDSRRWLRTAVGVHIQLDHEGKRRKCPNSLMGWLLSSPFYLVFLADVAKFEWRL
jgi:hypothetical protein